MNSNLYRQLFILTTFFSLTSGRFCSNLTIDEDDESIGCFLENASNNPIRLKTSGNSLILPCHVARSKYSIVEWWYNDPFNEINMKISPVFPSVRPTVLRFPTKIELNEKDQNEKDILDASILLRHVNIDDSGTYRCVIRSWKQNSMDNIEEFIFNDESVISTLNYQIEINAPRLCQSNPTMSPCFSSMRLTSPAHIDAYQTTFLQCVINHFNRPVKIFWIVGNEIDENILINDYLSQNEFKGDQLRRMFPLSPYDYSIELIVNRTIKYRSYSCVIQGNNQYETTIYTYHIRSIESEDSNQNEQKQNLTINSKSISNDNRNLSLHQILSEKQIYSLQGQKKNSTKLINETTIETLKMEETSTMIDS